ncbi:hypothetical protein [Streptomyces chrestomyceticus]|uniref:hypothetical protein n=1 Tax=Streptomyces chrestomyceticus TaxID=68185 RepID=UPI0019D20B4F|nr:hypothetical protein [Streptomyces chrestomyceticus]
MEAWETIRTSQFAGQFRDVDAQKPAPDDVVTVTERLAKMREQLPDSEILLDRRDAQTLGFIHVQQQRLFTGCGSSC